jgi:hypothetical protein
MRGSPMTETYREAFEFDIRMILSQGRFARRELFKWWLCTGPVFFCPRCDAEFEPRTSVDEDAEIACRQCTKKG